MSEYFSAITETVKGHLKLSSVWSSNLKSGLIKYNNVSDDEARAEAVGLQAKWDEAYSGLNYNESTLYVVMTDSPSNPFVLNRDNIGDFIASEKQETVLARIDVIEQILERGNPVVIGASRDGWKSIEGTSKQEIWQQRNEKCSNLYGVTIDIPEGLSGALTVHEDEMTSINFTQAHDTDASIAGKYIMAGNINTVSIFEKRVRETLYPLAKVDGDHQKDVWRILERNMY